MTDDEVARQRWAVIRNAHAEALRGQYNSRPDLWRTTFHRAGHVPMQFTVTLLDLAGGIWRLLEDWTPEPVSDPDRSSHR